MNYPRIIWAAVAATVADFIYGFLVYGLLLSGEYTPYTGVYRSGEAARSYLPLGFAGLFIAMLVLSRIYAQGYEGGRGVAEGGRFGVLVGIFVVFAFVGVNYATLNIGRRLALEMAVAALVEWTIMGMVIGLVYSRSVEARRSA